MTKEFLIGTVVTSIFAALSIWFARIAIPAYRLDIDIPVSRRLFQDHSPIVISGISVAVNGQGIASPYISIISIEVTGRSDIPREKFDRGLPLTIDAGAEILDVVQSDELNAIRSGGLTIASSGSTLSLGPDLMKSGQRSFLQILTEGPPDFTGLEHRIVDHLVDVRLAGRLTRRTAFERAINLLKVGSTLTLLALLVAGIFGAGLLYERSGHEERAPLISVSTSFPRSDGSGRPILRGVYFRANSNLTVKAIAWGDPSSQELDLGKVSTDHDGHFYLNLPEGLKSVHYLVTVLDDWEIVGMRLIDISNP